LFSICLFITLEGVEEDTLAKSRNDSFNGVLELKRGSSIRANKTV